MGFERDTEMAYWGTEFLRRGINAMDRQKNSVGRSRKPARHLAIDRFLRRGGGSGGRGCAAFKHVGKSPRLSPRLLSHSV